jgi:2-polyprenyl-6-methoxyphenol hydroxylase-like FAD-dependent oxidoreductase
MVDVDSPTDVDVLIVGAGPTGLALAAELRSFGVSFRIVDRAPDAVHESRALGIQARTLEVLAGLGMASPLIEAGDAATVLLLHTRRSVVTIKLFDEGVRETAYPFLLFLSQAETERILLDGLIAEGVTVERGVELLDVEQDADAVGCLLGTAGGARFGIRARYVVGCDGAHSAVRHRSGIGFAGTAFPQTFVLADLEIDGIEPGRVHAYLAEAGIMFFFPLGSPASWRMLLMIPPDAGVQQRTIQQLQKLVEGYTQDPVLLHDPVWLTDFSVQSRRADRFRTGRIFLAGDAAHIHSPAGAQGMNTGIQDAVNLGWKLAFVCHGLANENLLDSYEVERIPVARSVLRMTNRIFRVAITGNRMVRFLRPRMAAVFAPVVVRLGFVRRLGFRTISQLGIRYRPSALSVEGLPRLTRGPRAGDRFPDAAIAVDGDPTTLHGKLSATRLHLLLCGPVEQWHDAPVGAIEGRWPGLFEISYVTADAGPGVWADTSHTALRRLGVGNRETAHYLIRPDGYIAYRVRGTDFGGLEEYLHTILRG